MSRVATFIARSDEREDDRLTFKHEQTLDLPVGAYPVALAVGHVNDDRFIDLVRRAGNRRRIYIQRELVKMSR